MSATSKTDIDENQADQTRQQIKAIAPDQQTLDKLEEWDKKFLKAENNDIQEETSNQALADYQIQKWDDSFDKRHCNKKLLLILRKMRDHHRRKNR